MPLGLETPILKTKLNKKQLKSACSSLSLVCTAQEGPFLSHFKDWSVRAQLAGLGQELAVELSESPPPPFFCWSTLHLVGIVKP